MPDTFNCNTFFVQSLYPCWFLRVNIRSDISLAITIAFKVYAIVDCVCVCNVGVTCGGSTSAQRTEDLAQISQTFLISLSFQPLKVSLLMRKAPWLARGSCSTIYLNYLTYRSACRTLTIRVPAYAYDDHPRSICTRVVVWFVSAQHARACVHEIIAKCVRAFVRACSLHKIENAPLSFLGCTRLFSLRVRVCTIIIQYDVRACALHARWPHCRTRCCGQKCVRA